MALAFIAVILGLAMLVWSADRFVEGSASTARRFGMRPLLIGMVVVGFGTSLPELASSIIAARRGVHDIALGNILGSNLFNTLAVVGVAAAIQPLSVGAEVLDRDMLVMAALTLSLFAIGYGWRQSGGRISRSKGGLLLAAYLAYTAYLINTVWAG